MSIQDSVCVLGRSVLAQGQDLIYLCLYFQSSSPELACPYLFRPLLEVSMFLFKITLYSQSTRL